MLGRSSGGCAAQSRIRFTGSPVMVVVDVDHRENGRRACVAGCEEIGIRSGGSEIVVNVRNRVKNSYGGPVVPGQCRAEDAEGAMLVPGGPALRCARSSCASRNRRACRW